MGVALTVRSLLLTKVNADCICPMLPSRMRVTGAKQQNRANARRSSLQYHYEGWAGFVCGKAHTDNTRKCRRFSSRPRRKGMAIQPRGALGAESIGIIGFN
jgi:hypothetical protein